MALNDTPNLTTVSLLPQYLFRHSNYEHLRHGIFPVPEDFRGESDVRAQSGTSASRFTAQSGSLPYPDYRAAPQSELARLSGRWQRRPCPEPEGSQPFPCSRPAQEA